jgi:hypothetical protein
MMSQGNKGELKARLKSKEKKFWCSKDLFGKQTIISSLSIEVRCL